jgi:phosphoribosyl 1,2-cyclic phosphodiesterase
MGNLDLFHNPITLANLGSGSGGNASVVAGRRDAVLVDCGLSHKQILSRMQAVGLDPSRIRGIALSHEHADHVSGVRVAARRLGVPVWMTKGCRDALRFPLEFEVRLFEPGVAFRVGEIDVEPFRIPHDTQDPVAFVLGTGTERVGIATDLGSVTHLVVDKLRSCRAVLLEFNHDVEMLMNGSYPWELKQRVRGRLGHLSNEQGAEILGAIATGRVEEVLLGHLSEHNNTPRLALEAARAAIARVGDGSGRACPPRVGLCRQDQPSPVLRLLPGAVQRDGAADEAVTA